MEPRPPQKRLLSICNSVLNRETIHSNLALTSYFAATPYKNSHGPCDTDGFSRPTERYCAIGADFMGPEGLERPQYFGPGAHPANEPPPNNSHAKLQSMIIKRSQNLGKKRKLLISGEI